jgi:gas vesicle protein
VAGLIAIGVALYKNFDKIMEAGAKLKESISEAWDGVKSKTSETWEGIKGKTSEAWNSVKDKTTEMWTNVKDSISEKVDSAKKKISDTWDSVSGKTAETWSAIKGKTSETWGAIKGKIDENGGGIKGLIVTYAEAYETAWDTGLGLLESATGIKFTAIKDSISEKLEDMKRAIKNAVRKFIDLFDFEWSLPKPKVPKFSISGKFSLDPPSIPKIGIDWNAEGAIFTKPYVFGNQGFGEAGPEAVLPIEKLSGILANTLDKMETRSSSAIRYEHSGVIRVEGVNNQGQMVGVVDMVMDQLRREARGR